MRVAFDAGPLLDPPTGVGRYARELGEALELSGVEVARYAVALGGRPPEGVARLRMPARLARWSWQRWEKPRVEKLTGPVDVFHATNFVLPPTDAPGVVTVHDLSFFRDDVFPGGERLRVLVPWSIDRAARVFVPTASIADELSERLGFPRERTVVTPEGVSPVFFGATPLSDVTLGRMGIARPYAVAVGTIEPRKNLGNLLRAWTAARSDLEDWTLVLAGPKGWGPELPPTEAVRAIGWVGDETLPGLLAGADLFCYPSLYEGFGLPPLEAMASGTPTLVGRYAAAAEVLGDAALIVDARDVDAIAQGMVELATDGALRSRLRVKGRARATEFTWRATARMTIRGYSEAIDDRGDT
ncbi:MAG: glycosyltransferase [Actinobacteria bacterium]|nr:glycosyltransferase [Actinomycetota bacterium]